MSNFIPLQFRSATKLNSTKTKLNHNDLQGLNKNDYMHLTYEEYLGATNYASLTSDGILSKDDYNKLFTKNKISLNPNPLTGIIYGDNTEGFILTNENNDGFILKAPNSNNIYSINPTIDSPYDLVTKSYVDTNINNMLKSLSEVCANNSMLQNELKNYYNDIQIIQENNDLVSKVYLDTQLSALQVLLTKIININTNLQLQMVQKNLNDLNSL